jgi:NADH:ubiquinone oxidoreductase subunit E
MEIKEILSELEYNKGSFPYEAVEEAIKQKDKIIPELLKILENAEKNIHQIEEQPDYMAHIYAMFLLAQFREKRAYPLIVALFSHPGDTSDNIAGDFVTEDLQQVLASVCHGDTTLIKQLIENRDADEYVRAAGLSALLILVMHGKIPREEVVDYYKSLFRGKLEREPSMVWNELVVCSSTLCAEEVYEDIKTAFEEYLVDPLYINLEDVDKDLSMGWEKNLDRLKSDSHYQFIDDTIECMEWWYCFQPEKKVSAQRFKQLEQKSKGKKIGRNDPCPCGSGKKYKKCCGAIKNR